MNKNLLKHKNEIAKEIKQYFKTASIKKAVIGISGGIDSAVGLNLLIEILGKENVIPYFIDVESSKVDYQDAQVVCNQAGIELNYINLTKLYKVAKKTFKQTQTLALANLKSRLRAVFLYDQASTHNALVCGNSNLDELYVGYFTKFGDNACDVSMLCSFIKYEIRELAAYYHVPEQVINKEPTAGLYEGQTDEKELGVSYNEVDAFLCGLKSSDNAKKIINNLHSKNKHKLTYNYIVNKDNKRASCLRKK